MKPATLHRERYEKLKGGRRNWENLWQELADVLHPNRGDITYGQESGSRKTDHIYDGTPMRARRMLATTIDGLIKPKSAKWFTAATDDDELNEQDEVKRWFSVVDEVMWNAIYSRPARFIQRSGEVDNDLVTFGWGAMYIGENRGLNDLVFRSMHVKDVVIDENSDGVVDTLYYCMELTARQAEQKWGLEKLGPKTREALTEMDGKNKDKKFKFLWCVYPRYDRDPRLETSVNLPFASIVIDIASDDHEVETSGYHEFPFTVPRWETETGQIYPRSPGMMALPDANTLQAMGKTILVAGQKSVDPPFWMLDDSVIGAVRAFPGGSVVIDAEAARSFGQIPFGYLEMGKNIPLSREMQNDVRTMVEAAFFKNVFSLPVDGPDMTAYEVATRKEEFVRVMGPVFGQLEADYSGHIADRVFGILMRAGMFPEPPEILMGRDVKFKFQSPIQVARKQIEVNGMFAAFERLTPLIEVRPDLLDNYDLDEIARDVPDAQGAPQKWLMSLEKRDAMRQQRAEQQQMQQALLQTQQVADVAATARQAMPSAA